MNVNEIVDDAQANLKSFAEARKNLQDLRVKLVDDIESLEKTLAEVKIALGEEEDIDTPQEAQEQPSKPPKKADEAKTPTPAEEAPDEPQEESSLDKESSEEDPGETSPESTEAEETVAETIPEPEEEKNPARRSSSRRGKAAPKEVKAEVPAEDDDALSLLDEDTPTPPQVDDVFAEALKDDEEETLLDLSFNGEDEEDYDEPPF